MAATETRQLGMVGLGRMGANLVRRLMRDGHQCVVYDRSPGPIQQLASEGATGTSTLDEFVAALTKPRAAWVMVPAGEITGNTINQLADRMEAGRHHHRRRQLLLPRRHRARGQAVRAGRST